MSRTKRRDTYGRTFNQYKNEMIKDFTEDTWRWYSRKRTTLKQLIGCYQTEAMNWNSGGLKKNVKHHAKREQRSWDRVELAKVYRDHEYEVDDRYCHRNYRIRWIYD